MLNNFMQIALKKAKNVQQDIPIAALIVKDGEIIALETNKNMFEIFNFDKPVNGAEFFANGKVGLFKFTLKDIEETGADINDTTGLVNQITNVNGCEVGIMLYEKEKGLFRCSLRSAGNVDVAVIADQFGGGGHAFASGCNVFGCLNTAKNKIVTACIKEVKKLG